LEPSVGINLSIKNVDPAKVEQLKLRARRNHRSLQGELLALIDEATAPPPRTTLTIEEVSARVQSLGLARRSEATRMIREDRDR
jgi:hypothetical protein